MHFLRVSGLLKRVNIAKSIVWSADVPAGFYTQRRKRPQPSTVGDAAMRRDQDFNEDLFPNRVCHECTVLHQRHHLPDYD